MWSEESHSISFKELEFMEDYDTKKECFQQCLENFACLIMYAYTNEFASVSTLFLNLSYTHKSKWFISMNRFAVSDFLDQ